MQSVSEVSAERQEKLICQNQISERSGVFVLPSFVMKCFVTLFPCFLTVLIKHKK